MEHAKSLTEAQMSGLLDAIAASPSLPAELIMKEHVAVLRMMRRPAS